MFVGGFEKFAYQLFDRFPMHIIREKDKTKNATCNYRKKITSSGLCMRPRVHATFKLFTLGFVVTLLEMKKEKEKKFDELFWEKRIIMHLISGLSTRNI